MRQFRVVSLLPAAILVLVLGVPMMASAQVADQFVQAQLNSANENPIVLAPGHGAFTAYLTPDGINYQLTVSGATSTVTAAHLHVGNPWENGPVAATLCDDGMTPPRPACPQMDGESASGTIAAGDVLEAAPLAAMDLEGLKQLMAAGAIYVNVHTLDNGPGELRGQVSPRDR